MKQGGENTDKWLDASETVTIPEALQYLRGEYLTYVRSICRDNSPYHIVDAFNEAYKSQLKARHHFGKGIAHELSSIEEITEKGLRTITDKMTLDASKLTSLERTNDDLKKKVGTLETTISDLKTAHDNMVELLKGQVTEHKTTNAKINIQYSNGYGDKPQTFVTLSGITVENATKRDFDSHKATIETAKSIMDLQSDVSTPLHFSKDHH